MIAGQPVVVGNTRGIVVDVVTDERGTVIVVRPHGAPDQDDELDSVLEPDDQNLYEVVCEWFLLCENTATSMEPHPILGEVPICDRCHERNERLRA